MLIGHLPAGYLISRAFAAQPRVAAKRAGIMLFGLTGSVLPDIDLLWCYGVDGGRVHHHRYLTHWPSFWLLCLLAAWLALRLLRRQRPDVLPVLAFFTSVFAHLVLDTIVGDIWWLAPFVDQSYRWFTVPAIHKPWILNFVLHWSFTLELCLIAGAGYLCARDRGRRIA